MRGRLLGSVIEIWKEIEDEWIPDWNRLDVELDGAPRAVELPQDLPFGVSPARTKKDLPILGWALVHQCRLFPVFTVVSEFLPAGTLDDALRACLYDNIQMLLEADENAIAPWNTSLLDRKDAFHAVEVLVALQPLDLVKRQVTFDKVTDGGV